MNEESRIIATEKMKSKRGTAAVRERKKGSMKREPSSGAFTIMVMNFFRTCYDRSKSSNYSNIDGFHIFFSF